MLDHKFQWFITGFADAEASFSISITQSSTHTLGWRVVLSFSIHLHIKDIALLRKIKDFFKVGSVTSSGSDAYYMVRSMKELLTIINHFDLFPLVGYKSIDYLIFRKVYFMMKAKEHLTQEGLEKIIAMKAHHNLGWSEKVSNAFSYVIPIASPEYHFTFIPSPFWIAGFWSGDGSFSISILGDRVRLYFGSHLHIRDKAMSLAIHSYLCSWGSLMLEGSFFSLQAHSITYTIRNFTFITKVIIPFFDLYSIQGMKAEDFADFKKVNRMIQNKEHLTSEGLKKIIQINNNMNLKRKW